MFFFPNKPIEIFNIEKLIPELGDLKNWVLQPKWNGKRIEIDCNGKVRLFSREKREWFLPEWDWLSELPLAHPWFGDGELLRDGRIFVWDYALLAGERVFKTHYGPRLHHLEGSLSEPVCRLGYTVSCVESFPATDYKRFLEQADDPMLEGIVWKNLQATNFWGPRSTTKVSSQFKYRFPEG